MSASLRIVDLRGKPDTDLAAIIDHVRRGGVVAYPTETVYGIGSACTPAGVAAVQRVKGRSGDKPMLALVKDAAAVEGLRWSASARELASIFWPGSVTLVLDDPERIFPDGVRDARTGSVGVRMTPHPVAARLVDELEAPLTSTSLNVPGEPPVTSGAEAREILERLGATDVWLLDAGTLPPSPPSTVVDCTGDAPTVLRAGAVPLERLRCAIPETDERRD